MKFYRCFSLLHLYFLVIENRTVWGINGTEAKHAEAELALSHVGEIALSFARLEDDKFLASLLLLLSFTSGEKQRRGKMASCL